MESNQFQTVLNTFCLSIVLHGSKNFARLSHCLVLNFDNKNKEKNNLYLCSEDQLFFFFLFTHWLQL